MNPLEIVNLVHEKKTLNQIRVIFEIYSDTIPHLKKDLNTWGSVESLFQRLTSQQISYIYNEIEIIENIKKNVTLADLREILKLLNIKFTKSHLYTWNKSSSFLRKLDPNKSQKILDIIKIIQPFLDYSSLSRLEEIANELRISFSKESFFTRKNSKEWLISRSKEEQIKIVKEISIDDLFYRFDSIDDAEKIIKFFNKKKKFRSWKDARIYFSKEFEINDLENFGFDFYEIFYDLGEVSGKTQEIDIENVTKVFFSYSLKDKLKFNIPKIENELSKSPKIEVLYYERDADENIITYMTEGIKKSDILLLFCSENSYESDSVKDEWTAAYKKKKKIIPIFIDENYIPDLISTRRGVKFDNKNIKDTIHEIEKIIKMKFKE